MRQSDNIKLKLVIDEEQGFEPGTRRCNIFRLLFVFEIINMLVIFVSGDGCGFLSFWDLFYVFRLLIEGIYEINDKVDK